MSEVHYPMECLNCGSRTWRLYEGEYGSISAKYSSCGRQILCKAIPDGNIESVGVGQQHEHDFFVQVETSESDLRIASIPRGVDPKTMLTDPRTVVKI